MLQKMYLGLRPGSDKGWLCDGRSEEFGRRCQMNWNRGDRQPLVRRASCSPVSFFYFPSVSVLNAHHRPCAEVQDSDVGQLGSFLGTTRDASAVETGNGTLRTLTYHVQNALLVAAPKGVVHPQVDCRVVKYSALSNCCLEFAENLGITAALQFNGHAQQTGCLQAVAVEAPKVLVMEQHAWL